MGKRKIPLRSLKFIWLIPRRLSKLKRMLKNRLRRK